MAMIVYLVIAVFGLMFLAFSLLGLDPSLK